MPLIIICGYPSSGKTTLSKKLKIYFEEESNKPTHVDIVSDSTYQKNETFSGVSKEKNMRSNLKSEVNRLLGNESIVILDASNYIKGYRYELFCLSKLMKTTHLVIHSDVNRETAWQWNISRTDSEIYTQEVFDALIQRFEAPDSRNRWDKPLITVLSDGEISMDEVSDAVFAKQRLKPNKSTQSIPLNSTNYLYELDQKTQEVVNFILEAQRSGETGGIKIPNSNVQMAVSAGELARLRRQFISYSKSHMSDANVINMFIQYLNTTIT